MAGNSPPRGRSGKANSGIRDSLGDRSIVLVGLMGAGKTTVGRRLAARLGLPFCDADTEIEDAAGMSVADIFDEHGEDHFRTGERKVIVRLLGEGPQVLATGGGAYINAETRKAIARAGVSVWLKADLDVLYHRVRKKSHRPLLKNPDPKGVLGKLMKERYPVYGKADITVTSRDEPHDAIVTAIVKALKSKLNAQAT